MRSRLRILQIRLAGYVQIVLTLVLFAFIDRLPYLVGLCFVNTSLPRDYAALVLLPIDWWTFCLLSGFVNIICLPYWICLL